MSKRVAAFQISDRQPYELDDEPDLEASKASSEVMAKRKIIKPRGLSNKNGASAAPKPFAFASAAPQASAPANPFLFVAVAKPSESSDRDNKIKALNEKFIESINKTNEPSSIANFTSIAKKYIEYYEKIDTIGAPSAPQPIVSAPKPPVSGFTFSSNGFNPQSTPIVPVSVPEVPKETQKAQPPKVQEIKPQESDSESSSDDDIKIEGPQFTLASKPTIKKPVFSFGKKPAKPVDSDSDSESEVEIKGPTFTFNKQIKDDVFKIKNNKKEEAPKPSFNFGAPASEKPAVSFGNNDKPSDKPAFSFPDSAKSSNDKPAFSFGSKPDSNEKLAFSFGAKQESSEKPAFAFGSKAESSDKPSFSFGSNGKTDKPAFSFGAKPVSAVENGQAESKKENNVESSFSFGSNTTDGKPAFQFGSNGSSSEKPAVSFTSSASTSADKPAFSFGASATTASADSNDKPKTLFNFGKPADSGNTTSNPSSKPADSKPAFPFGAAASTTEEKKDEAQKPAFLFSFNPPKQSTDAPVSEIKPISFGGSSNGTSLFGGAKSSGAFSFGNNSTPASNNKVQDEEKVEEEETGGDFKPVAQLSEQADTNTGEEGEDVLYTKRTKLMLFDPENKEQPYMNKGLGDLKVLKNTETGKSRVLVRADGGFRVLLNTLISKDMSYSSLGNGSMVRVPTINEDKQIETFVLKVKTPADGEELLKIINDAK